MKMEVKKVYAYVRVSTRKQNPARQYRNIEYYAQQHGLILTRTFEDKFTGTSINRPAFDSLRKTIETDIKEGREVTVIFDSVSRMSRTAEEGVKQYFEWYDEGVNLVFLHNSTICTEQYKISLKEIGLTGTDVDVILNGINQFFRKLARNQIVAAFQQAENEAIAIKKRVVEGLEASDKKSGRPILAEGERIETNKAIQAKKYILKHCRRFGGELNDTQTMKCAEISRPTFYRYLKEIEIDNNGAAE